MLELKNEWVADRLWVLLNVTNRETLQCVFPDLKWDSITRKRRHYRNLIEQGEHMAPERPEWYTEGMTPDEIFERLNNVAPALGATAVNPVIDNSERSLLHTELDKIIDQGNANADAVEGFDVVSGSYEGQTKNADGEVVVTELRKRSVRIRYRKENPNDAEPPEFVAIQRHTTAEPLPYNPTRYEEGQWRRTVILPDFQIGYRNTPDGLAPFHDEKAIDVMLQVLSEQNKDAIDHIVILGDYLDFPQFGKYRQEPEWANTLNASIEYGWRMLATLRQMFPGAKMSMLEGNHDVRLANDIKDHYAKIHGIRRKGGGEELLSVPHLLAFDELNIEYAAGYPAGRVEITPKFQAIHGEIVKKGGTAKAVTEYEGVSTVHGHTHRFESYGRTVRTLGGVGMRQTFAFSPGTLSSITGSVPSVHGGVNKNGSNFNPEDWQQGFALVDHDGNNFQYNQVFINTPEGYLTRFEGKTYVPRTAEA
jgi:hypothetical protein